MRFYLYIKYIKGNVVHDTTLLFNAYNIIAGYSSFISEIIYFFKKLQKLWTYRGLFYFQLSFLKVKILFIMSWMLLKSIWKKLGHGKIHRINII